MYICKICANCCVSFPWWLKIVKSRSKIAFFQMSTILKFDFQNENNNIFLKKKKYVDYPKKDTLLHGTIIFFPKTRANKSKQWTHYSALKVTVCFLLDWSGLPCLVQLLNLITRGGTTVVFGTLEDGSLQINNLTSNNCFSYLNVFQNGVNALSKMIDQFLSKSSKFNVVLAIRFCSNSPACGPNTY